MWALFVFNKPLSPLPDKTMFFVEADSISSARRIFLKQKSRSPRMYFDYVEGEAIQEAWAAAINKGLVRLKMTFDKKILEFPFVEVIYSQRQSSIGMNCNKCKTHYEYAVQPEDGSPFICWSCKNGY